MTTRALRGTDLRLARLRSVAREWAWAAYVQPKGRFGNWLQGVLLGFVESRRVRRAWSHATRIFLVHTPGKVGSKAIVAALRPYLRPEDALFHTHRINPDGLRSSARERAGLAPRRTWYTADFLGRALREPHDKEVIVVAAVRDPMQRALSSFLQNIERYGETGRAITALSRVDVADLNRQFIEHFDHMAIVRWVEIELDSLFDANTFAPPFDHHAGFQILEAERALVGVIRHDRFGDALLPFLRRLTGFDIPEVARVNDSSAKSYANLYRHMRETLLVPDDLLEGLYQSAYARHFFTQEERDEAIQRWSSP